MSYPLVSVVIATYRRTRTLERAIGSLADQTYTEFEVIVVDDNADEEWNSAVSDIVRGISVKYPDLSVTLITNPVNKGSAETRNVGIRASNGEYVTFLDDDDVYLPEKIQHQLSGMLESGADYSITDMFLYNEDDRLCDRRVRNYIEKNDNKSLLKYHLMHHLTGTDTMMLRHDYLDKIGGFPPINVGDEFYLMYEAINGGGKFVYLPGCFVKAYVHGEDGGLSSGQSKIDGENALYNFKKARFDLIDRKAVRFIRMRHYAVLSFVEARKKHYFKFLKYSLWSFVSSPVNCLKLLSGEGR